jgi:transcriptional regulator with XRE-family HTH domain
MINPKLFRQVRKALGFTQQQLADRLGLSRVTVNKMERGRLRRGIPDEIGAKLLELKPQMTTKVTTEVAAARKAFVRASSRAESTQAFLDDTHLWDNEEDE